MKTLFDSLLDWPERQALLGRWRYESEIGARRSMAAINGGGRESHARYDI